MRLQISGSSWLFVVAALAAGPVEARPSPAEKRGEPAKAALPPDGYRYTPDPSALPQNDRLPFTPCVGGMAGPYPCNNVDLMSFLPLNTIGGGNGSSLWGWTDPDTQREYAIMGRTNGTAFVDITDAANPMFLGNLKSHTGTSSWREMKTYGYYAYIISDNNGNHGMQIFDMRHLRNPSTTPQLREDGWYGGFANCHDLVMNTDTGFAYGVGSNTCSGGLHMMSLANPLAPQFVGCFSADGYTHDAQCVIYHGPDTAHFGQEICFASNTDTLTIVDVTNKSAPVMISRTSYAGVGYTHQGWLTANHAHFLIDDELDETNFGHPTWTYIWNVSDLEAPVLIGHYTGPTNAIDHNQYIHQGFSYQANYQAGLRILDVANIAAGNLSEVAYFDIYPSSNNPSFNGAWNNYPFFASGNVIVSGIEQGLFVLHPNLPTTFTMTAAKDVLAACVGGSDATALTFDGQNGYTGSVALSATGLPAGAAATFDPVQAAVPGTSELTLAASSAAPGAYAVTVNATDGVQTHQKDLTLYVADLTPEEPVLISPPNSAANQGSQPVFTWAAAEQGATYDIQIATDPGFANVVSQAAARAALTFTPPSPLTPNTSYFWRVRAVNGCAAGTWSDVSSFTTTSPAGVCPMGTAASVVSSEDFESGAPGWTTGGTGTTWAPSSAQVHSGGLSFRAVAPDVVTDQRLISPAITLPTGQSPLSMQFWNYQVLESQGGEHTVGCWDGGIAEISTDDGLTWNQLPGTVLLTDPYHALVAAGAGNPLADKYAWCGSAQPWLDSVVDVDAYAGRTVRFRFRLGTNSTVGTEGWYVDDFRVQSCVAQVPKLTVADLTVSEAHPEGSEHPSTAVFTLTLSAPAAAAVTLDYRTSNGTATAGLDYVGTMGTLTIPAGAMAGTVDVVILDDSLPEPKETFFLDITNVSGATVADSQGKATIVDDDTQ
jgi:choice-of-anchor B domain-containing protein